MYIHYANVRVAYSTCGHVTVPVRVHVYIYDVLQLRGCSCFSRFVSVSVCILHLCIGFVITSAFSESNINDGAKGSAFTQWLIQ